MSSPLGHGAIVEAAAELAPLLAAHARQAEIDRKPADVVIAGAADAGLFDIMVPRAYGGLELDLDTFFEVGVVLGEADASMAWVILFYIEHNWMFCQFPDTFQLEVFTDATHVLAPAMLSPSGTARRVPGGYRLDGRWQWATGIVHGSWVIAGAVNREGERPQALFFALPRGDVVVEDTWYTDGMCGTGSHDVVIADQFVPEERSVDIAAMMNATAPGSSVHGGALYRTPMAPILSYAGSLPALGAARFAVREYARQLQGRTDALTQTRHADGATHQIRLGRAQVIVRSAEALMRGVLGEVMACRAEATSAQRVEWTATIAHAVSLCRDAIDLVCGGAGASSHFLDNPLQRARRDVNAIGCHMVFDTDQRLGALGRTLLDLPSNSRWH